MPFLHHDQIVHFFMIRNLRNYACSLYFNLQASPQMGMPFDKFTQLTLTQKVTGYHADTPITIKAEPFIWPTAALINIHEHPI